MNFFSPRQRQQRASSSSSSMTRWGNANPQGPPSAPSLLQEVPESPRLSTNEEERDSVLLWTLSRIQEALHVPNAKRFIKNHVDEQGRTVLHHACMDRTVTVPLLESILQHWKAASFTLDAHGKIPLQTALERGCSTVVLRWLLQQLSPSQIKLWLQQQKVGFLHSLLHPDRYYHHGQQEQGPNNEYLEWIQDILQHMKDSRHLLPLLSGGSSSTDSFFWMGQTPLHVACQTARVSDTSTQKVVAWLAYSYRHAITVKDPDGNLPLHLACQDAHCTVDTIQYLILVYSKTSSACTVYDLIFKLENKRGVTLFLAACSSSCLDVVQFLVQHCRQDIQQQQQAPEALNQLRAALQSAIELDFSESITTFLQEQLLLLDQQQQLSQSTSFRTTQSSEEGTGCTLHNAEWIQERVALEPTWQDEQKRTLVHHACRLPPTRDVIQGLVKAWPAALSQRDAFGCYPLDYAVQTAITATAASDDADCSTAAASLEVIRFLAEKYPAAIPNVCLHSLLLCSSQSDQQGSQRSVNNNDDDMLLHDVIKVLVEVERKSKLNSGWLLHNKKTSSNSGPQSERTLLRFMGIGNNNNRNSSSSSSVNSSSQSSKSSLVRNHKNETQHGRLPLHAACMFASPDRPWTQCIVQLLIQHGMEAVHETDELGNLPLHYACQDARCTATTIDYLLRVSGHNASAAAATAAAQRNAEGYLPLHLACQSRRTSVDTIRVLVEACPSSLRSPVWNHVSNAGSGGGDSSTLDEEEDESSPHDTLPLLPLDLAKTSGCSEDVISYLENHKAAAAAARPDFASFSSSSTSSSSSPLLQDARPSFRRQGSSGMDGSDWNGSSFSSLPFSLSDNNGMAVVDIGSRDGDESGESILSVQDMEEILRVNPKSIKGMLDKQGRTVLHQACCHRSVSLDLIVRLVENWLDAIRKRDKCQRIPLHQAIQSACSMEIIRFLITKWPTCIRNCPLQQALTWYHSRCMRDNEDDDCSDYLELSKLWVDKWPECLRERDPTTGQLPLHTACLLADASKQNTQIVVQTLTYRHRHAAKSKDREGNLPLHYACAQHRCTTVTIDYVLKNSGNNAVGTLNNRGVSPLHCACTASTTSLETMTKLVQACPSALEIRTKDEDKFLPFQLATRCNCAKPVIEYLQSQTGATTDVPGQPTRHNRNDSSGTPLTMQISSTQFSSQSSISQSQDNECGSEILNDEITSLEAIDLNLRQMGQRRTDPRGRTLLHLACCHRSVPLDLIERLIQAWRGAVKRKDKDGLLPLHKSIVACCPAVVVRRLLQEWPASAKEVCLHVVLQTYGSPRGDVECDDPDYLKVVQSLVEAWPKAIQKVDPKTGRLPLHTACSVASPSRLFMQDIVLFLAFKYSGANNIQDKSGCYPLQCANKKALRSQVLDYLIQNSRDDVAQIVSTWVDTTSSIDSSEHGELEESTLRSERQVPRTIQGEISIGSAQMDDAASTSDNEPPQEIEPHLDPERQENDIQQPPIVEVVTDPITTDPTTEMPEQQLPQISQDETSIDSVPMDNAVLPIDNNLPLVTETPREPERQENVIQARLMVDAVNDPTTRDPATEVPEPQIRQDTTSSENIHMDDAALTAEGELALSTEQQMIHNVIANHRGPVAVSSVYIESIIDQTRKLGEGFFGIVYRGRDPQLGKDFAVKSIPLELLSEGRIADLEKARTSFFKEQETLARFQHPNIARMYAYHLSDDLRARQYLVYEFGEKGSLDAFWKDEVARERLCSFRQRVQIALEIITAIRFLHMGNGPVQACFHRDIKSANVILMGDFTAKLTDCGLAKHVDDGGTNATSTGVRGTPGYVCPRYGHGGMNFEASCDIFSFGVVLAEIWSGKLQNHLDDAGKSYNYYFDYIIDGDREMESDLDKSLGFDTKSLPSYAKDYTRLALSCISSKPKDRPSGEDVMNQLRRIWEAAEVEEAVCNSPVESQSRSLIPGLMESLPPERDLVSLKCSWCRTNEQKPGFPLCEVCLVLQKDRMDWVAVVRTAIRAELSPFIHEIRMFHASTREALDVMGRNFESLFHFLSHLDGRLVNPIPRLFVLLPADMKSCLRTVFHQRLRLYFVCGHSGEIIDSPVKLIASRAWVDKIAPVLGYSLLLLHVIMVATGRDLQLCRVASTVFKISCDTVAKTLIEVGIGLSDEGREICRRVKEQETLEDGDIRVLNGDAFELVKEKAMKQRGWMNHMKLVRVKGEAKTLWVANKYAGGDLYDL